MHTSYKKLFRRRPWKGALYLLLASTVAQPMLSTEAQARSLKELFEEEEVRGIYLSSRSFEELEMCIGMGLSEIWPSMPYVLHGDSELIIATASSKTVVFAFRVTEEEGLRRIAIYSTRGWHNRTAPVVEACVN